MSCQLKVVDLNCLPPAEEILGAKESAFFKTLRFPKRRTEWLGGRLALKDLVQQATGAAKKEIEICHKQAVSRFCLWGEKPVCYRLVLRIATDLP